MDRKTAYRKQSTDVITYSGYEYFAKDVASKHSGLSVRRLLELAARGDIRKRHIRDPKSKRKIAVFCAGDIRNLAQGNYPTRPVIDGQKRVTAIMPLRNRAAMLRMFPHSDFPDIAAAPAPKLWMTAAEAAEYSGLPAPFLVDLVKLHKLPALDVGVRAGGRYRIAKRDIDDLRGEKRR